MIQVLPYDPKWMDTFRQIEAVVWPAISGIAIRIEHVGSTSVPGLHAKPVVDIVVVVASKRTSLEATKILQSLGYQHRGDLGIKDREAFLRPENSPKHNLYVVLQGSLSLRNHLALKKLLLERKDLCDRYSALKHELALRFANDIDRYCESKTEFIVECLQQCGFNASDLNEIRKANNVPMQWTYSLDGLRLTSIDVNDASTLYEVYRNSPTYFRRVDGVEPHPDMPAKDIVDVPPTHGEHYVKVAALIYADANADAGGESNSAPAIGYADLHVHHRSLGIAYLGLLILREDVQGKGVGRRAYGLVEKFLTDVFAVEKICLGVSDHNQVQDYWLRMGFIPNDFTYPWIGDKVESVCSEMEKRIQPPRLHIERPSKALYPSFLKFVADMKAGNQTLWDAYVPLEGESAEQFIVRLHSRETAPAAGFVPETVYWAVFDGQVAGRISLRHNLEGNLHNIGGHIGYEVGPSSRKRGFATEMLRLVLLTEKAKQIGKVLLTCSPGNEASNKTIVRNGGVLTKVMFVDSVGEDRNHYWIEVAQ